jgi:hypothetical protein
MSRARSKLDQIAAGHDHAPEVHVVSSIIVTIIRRSRARRHRKSLRHAVVSRLSIIKDAAIEISAIIGPTGFWVKDAPQLSLMVVVAFDPKRTTDRLDPRKKIACARSLKPTEAGCGRPGASREVLSFSLRSPLIEPPSVIDVAYWHFSDMARCPS